MIQSYKPQLKDLWFRQKMLEDPETMSYNQAWGGVISFPKERWEDWYRRWVLAPDDERYYRYLQDDTGTFLGEIAYHYDPELDAHLANVIIYAPYRSKGFGSKGLDILCQAAKANGISEIYDNIAIDNSAVDLFLMHGFHEEYRTEEIIMLKKEL
ncbi:MAG: GNAT family N-acetyltransferase [Eubacteriales bacterium]|nr:GNAT family N-acetyltransferase [Eubacteriales bacterium]